MPGNFFFNAREEKKVLTSEMDGDFSPVCLRVHPLSHEEVISNFGEHRGSILLKRAEILMKGWIIGRFIYFIL